MSPLAHVGWRGRDHKGRGSTGERMVCSHPCIGEPLEMRGGNCPKDKMAQKVGGSALRQESPWGQLGRERSGAVSTFTSEVEDSKEENSRERRNKEVGLALLQGPLGW